MTNERNHRFVCQEGCREWKFSRFIPVHTENSQCTWNETCGIGVHSLVDTQQSFNVLSDIRHGNFCAILK